MPLSRLRVLAQVDPANKVQESDLSLTDGSTKCATGDLEETIRTLRSVVYAAPAVMYILNVPEARQIFISDYIETATGVSAPEVIRSGSDFLTQLAHPDDLGILTEHFALLAQVPDGNAVVCEYRLRHRDGGWHWFCSSDRVLERDEQGQIKLIVGAATE